MPDPERRTIYPLSSVESIRDTLGRAAELGFTDVTVPWLRRRPDRGMVTGMVGTRKVTITLSVATVDRVRQLVEAGQTASISGFVQHAVAVALDDVGGWGSALSEALAGTGGELSAQERAWADNVLDHGEQTGAA